MWVNVSNIGHFLLLLQSRFVAGNVPCSDGKDFLTRIFFSLDFPVIFGRNSKGDKLLLYFKGFTLDTDRRELNGPDGNVHVEPQVFDLLYYFAQNTNRVISKDELIEQVWKGRIVSDAALNSRINSARRAIGDSGEKQVLIRTVPRRGFLFAVEATTRTDERSVSPAKAETPIEPSNLALPDKPSIAILPFQNLSSDLEQDYFADGIVEEIITALSRFRNMFVISRNSSFVYKGRASDVKQIGRELGVRYVLEGSIRKAANRVRITGQLIDASIGTHLWADRYEGTLEDVFDLQDRLTTSVVGAIAPKLEQAEIERAKHKPTESLDAYDCFLRGLASVHQWTKKSNDEALAYFKTAVERDAGFAAAYGMGAWCHTWRKMSGWIGSREKEVAETAQWARMAAELGKDDAVALCTGGWGLAYVVGELDDGAAFVERALILNPNYAWGWLFSGWLKIWFGEPEKVIEQVSYSMRLSPNDPLIFVMHTAIAAAHFFAGRLDDASAWAQSSLRAQPRFTVTWRIAAASNALAGRLEQAQKAVEQLLQLDAGLRVSILKDLAPFRRPEDLKKYEEGLRLAGLPE